MNKVGQVRKNRCFIYNFATTTDESTSSSMVAMQFVVAKIYLAQLTLGQTNFGEWCIPTYKFSAFESRDESGWRGEIRKTKMQCF